MDPSQVLTVVPPKYLPYIMVGLITFKAVDFALQGLHAWFPNNKTIGVLEHWTGAISPRLPKTLTPPPPPVIGSTVTSKTPGAVPPAALLLCLAVGSWVACAHVTPLEQNLINCGEAALSTEATAVGPQVLSILTGGAVDWASQLTQLVTTLGTGVVCAVQAIVNSITNKATAGALAPADQIALVRAQAWLNAYGVRTPAAGMQIRVVKP
jgi:hypothetical protein